MIWRDQASGLTFNPQISRGAGPQHDPLCHNYTGQRALVRRTDGCGRKLCCVNTNVTKLCHQPEVLIQNGIFICRH